LKIFSHEGIIVSFFSVSPCFLWLSTHFYRSAGSGRKSELVL